MLHFCMFYRCIDIYKIVYYVSVCGKQIKLDDWTICCDISAVIILCFCHREKADSAWLYLELCLHHMCVSRGHESQCEAEIRFFTEQILNSSNWGDWFSNRAQVAPSGQTQYCTLTGLWISLEKFCSKAFLAFCLTDWHLSWTLSLWFNCFTPPQWHFSFTQVLVSYDFSVDPF